jgi:hypothetical protein
VKKSSFFAICVATLALWFSWAHHGDVAAIMKRCDHHWDCRRNAVDHPRHFVFDVADATANHLLVLSWKAE